MHVYTWCSTCLKDCKHYVVKEGQNPVVRCDSCKTVHSTTSKGVKQIDVRVVISVDNLSFKRKIMLDPDNIVNVGDEYLIEDEDEVRSVEVTILELKDGKRMKNAKVKDIETIWSRFLDYIVLKVSISKRGKTWSIRIRSPGDYDFVVGNTEHLDKETFKISALKMRDGRMLRQIGDVACAKDVKRIYGRSA